MIYHKVNRVNRRPFELVTHGLTRRITPDILGALSLVHTHIVDFELGRKRERSWVDSCECLGHRKRKDNALQLQPV